MKTPVKMWVLGTAAIGLLLVGQAPEAPLRLSLVPPAAAIFGAPLSPLSFAGVARRTTRRAVVLTSSAAATEAAAASSVAAQPQAPPSPPQPAPAAAPPQGAPPIGTIVATLPQGCVASPKGGVQYYDCGGVYYRAAFQGNNLVYVVQQP